MMRSERSSLISDGLSLVAQSVSIALQSLRRNTLRSFLTALGIIIGVASVVAMVAVGNGAQARITSQVSALGENLLTVFAGSKRSSGISSGLGSASTMTLADAGAMAREIPDVTAVSPEASTTAQVLANGRNWSTTIAGESEEYLKIRDWQLEAGAMFDKHEVRSAATVAVIGSEVASRLFGPLSPVGQTLRIKGNLFTVIGKLKSKGASMGMNQDDRIIIPYTTAMKRITGERYLRSISVRIASADRMAAAQDQIASLLRQRHRIAAGQDNDFNIFNQKEIADTVRSISGVITLLLGSVAGISLFVGGIGIMNIMLVSVIERTREIGIRIAVGAQPADIRLQFLIESVVLSLTGGLLGILLGVAASMLVGMFANFEAVVSASSIGVAFAVSSAIGIFFGFYPANKAAGYNPIDALRYE